MNGDKSPPPCECLEKKSGPGNESERERKKYATKTDPKPPKPPPTIVDADGGRESHHALVQGQGPLHDELVARGVGDDQRVGAQPRQGRDRRRWAVGVLRVDLARHGLGRLARAAPKVDDVAPGVGEELLAKALEVAVDQRQHPPAIVLERELPCQKAALDRRKLAMAWGERGVGEEVPGAA